MTRKEMVIEEDGRGNKFINVKNLRITHVEKARRSKTKNWADADVIRIQAYKDVGSNALFQGAEMPLKNSKDLLKIISAIALLWAEK